MAAPDRPRPHAGRGPAGLKPVRDDSATAWEVCVAPISPTGRQRWCSARCRQRAWHRRGAAPRQPVPTKAPTVYACPPCDARYLGGQRCEDCNTWCTKVRPRGPCAHCDEPVATSGPVALNRPVRSSPRGAHGQPWVPLQGPLSARWASVLAPWGSPTGSPQGLVPPAQRAERGARQREEGAEEGGHLTNA